MACQSVKEYISPHILIPQKVQWYPEYQNTFVIANPASSLVLDGGHYIVALEEYTGSPLQQWQFECTDDGSFLLKNAGTEGYLHVDEDSDVITKAKNSEPTQQWSYNSQDQTISNRGTKKVLTIKNQEFIPNADIIADEKLGTSNQKFSFHSHN